MKSNDKIKAARKDAGLTQKRMSELLNIPLRTIEDWERGVREPADWAAALIVEKLQRIREENAEK